MKRRRLGQFWGLTRGLTRDKYHFLKGLRQFKRKRKWVIHLLWCNNKIHRVLYLVLYFLMFFSVIIVLALSPNGLLYFLWTTLTLAPTKKIFVMLLASQSFTRMQTSHAICVLRVKWYFSNYINVLNIKFN